MPTRKDKTNVTPIYREQVFIPASGATLLKQKARPKVAGRPVSSGAVEIVSPEFDLLTGIRGIANLPKGFLKTNKLPQGENLYYRQLDKSSRGLERAKQVGVIDTKSSGGVNFTTSRGTTLRIGKTFDTPFFAKGSLWYNNVDDMDVIVGKDNPLLDWKMITQHGRVTENAVKAANRRTPFYNGTTNQAPTELFELYRRYPGIGYRNVTYGFPTIPITGLNTAAEQMKCGGRRKAQLGLDIQYGGRAIPIARNMVYFDGNSHATGGIGVGNNLEVEGGEVGEKKGNTLRIFSGVPFLGGMSPAQLVMGGVNPNTVFKAQEAFKDRNRIKDDGTRYQNGGEKIYTPSKFIQRQIQETGKVTIGGTPTIGGIRTYGYLKGLTTVRKFANKGTNIFTKGIDNLNKKLQSLVNERKISSKTAQFASSMYAQFIGRYGQNIPKTISLARDDNKKKFGGNMIYEINGNVKNGLMSSRPKAQYGKEKKINEDTKIGDDGLIYKRDARGEWWTDGTTYQNSKYYMREQSVQRGGKRSTGEVVKPKVQTQSLPEVIVTAKAPKSKGINLSNLEEDYMIGKRRSANRHPVPDFVGEVNKGKEVVSSNVSSIPRKGRTKATTSNATSKSTPTIQDTVNQITRDAIYKSNTPKIDLSKAKMPTFDVSQLGSKETKAVKAKLNTSSTGGGKQSNSDGRWIPQFNSITTRDWIGLGSNLAGHIASYFTNNALLSKYPMPTKPVMAQAAKLKTRYNVEPQLTNIREAEQMNRASVRRNTQSSNTSLAREQRLMNEARGARNVLYGQKENIETQLINQDRMNRQSVYQRNVAAYNDWLDKTFVAKNNKLMAKQQNMMNLISGIPMAVNNIIGNIESRQATNNTIKAIAAANPNVDGRLLGIGDYYTQRLGDGRVAIYNKNGKLKKYV